MTPRNEVDADEARRALGSIRGAYEQEAQAVYQKSAQKCDWSQLWKLRPPCFGHYPVYTPDAMVAFKQWQADAQRFSWGHPFPRDLNHQNYFCALECIWRSECYPETQARKEEVEKGDRS